MMIICQRSPTTAHITWRKRVIEFHRLSFETSYLNLSYLYPLDKDRRPPARFMNVQDKIALFPLAPMDEFPEKKLLNFIALNFLFLHLR